MALAVFDVLPLSCLQSITCASLGPRKKRRLRWHRTNGKIDPTSFLRHFVLRHYVIPSGSTALCDLTHFAWLLYSIRFPTQKTLASRVRRPWAGGRRRRFTRRKPSGISCRTCDRHRSRAARGRQRESHQRDVVC